MAQRSTGTRYMLLANHLKERIARGDAAAGSLLPSEAELCAQFGVSRITVRAALKELETLRLISRRPGVGTRVEPAQPRLPFAHIGDSVDELLQFTTGIPIRVIESAEIIVTEHLADELQLSAGLSMLYVDATRQLHDAPVVYSRHYIPALVAPPVQRIDGLRMSLAEWLAQQHGDQVTTVRQQVSAVALTRKEAARLGRKAGRPALRSTRWYLGGMDRLLLLTVSVFPGSDYSFRSVIRRGPA